jgi:hypothetical protein
MRKSDVTQYAMFSYHSLVSAAFMPLRHPDETKAA